MFITNHVGEDPVERQPVLALFPSLGSLESSSLELLAVAMADEEVVGVAATGEVSASGSRLVGFDLTGGYADPAVEQGLFNYLAWELREKRKSYLVIEAAREGDAISAVLRDMGCEAGEKTVIKIDWTPFLKN